MPRFLTICWSRSSIQHVPLHDGAVIIQNGRIAAAACFLPLTVKPRLSKELGTRHRAAIGVTEETDAVAIIVSEETGAISFAHDGEIERFLDADTAEASTTHARQSWSAGRRRGTTELHNQMRMLKELPDAQLVREAVLAGACNDAVGDHVERGRLRKSALSVPLEYRNIPGRLEVTGDTTNTVEVRLRGPSTLIREISTRRTFRQLSISVSLTSRRRRSVHLTPQNVRAPFGIEVVRVNPVAGRLNLERTMSKTLPVVVQTHGRTGSRL